MRRNGTVSVLGSVVLLVCCLSAGVALADSQARIVRLSDLDGNVQVDRGNGFEKAVRNMPITQGMSIQTEQGALAEVEFENGSTVRLAPNSEVLFPLLSLADSGAKQSTVEVKQGTAYFNLARDKRGQFKIAVGPETTIVDSNARFRVDLHPDKAQVAVNKGELKFQGPSGEAKVDSDHTLTFNLGGSDPYTLAKGVDSQPYDSWNRQESQFQSQYGAGGSSHSWPVYGMSDLNYYGDWFNVPGYGVMWQPYSMGYGWDPFMNGSWMWYPGFGYTFVSSYPWGWTPYRYGSWAFVPGLGWGWQPGGFATWNIIPPVYNAPAGYVPPRRPVTGVAAGHPTIAVRPPTATSGLAASPRTAGALASPRPAAALPVHGQLVPLDPRTRAIERGFNMGIQRPASPQSMGRIRSIGPGSGTRSVGRAGAGFGSAAAHASGSSASHAGGGSSSHH
jgi:hypothetical protein